MAHALFNTVLTRADSYKYPHFLQYPPGMTAAYSYVESRGGRWPSTLFFGLQMYLEKLAVPITLQDVEETEEDVRAHGLPFNRAGFERVVRKHGGLMPVTISALPEGLLVPGRTPLVTVTGNDPELCELPGFLETGLMRGVWFPTTVSTNSFYCKVEIMEALRISCDDPAAQIAYRLHDFSARGVSSGETAEIGGAAHLVNFLGTDTFECLRAIRRVYGEAMAGRSVCASEHATTTSWGRAGEADFYRHMLRTFARPGDLVACVSDSYDLWHAINSIWGDKLREEVIATGATVVVRPDSGDPETVPVLAVEALAEKFGSTTNTKGYRVLHPSVRVIQGDKVCQETIRAILRNLLAAGFSAENLAFGMGSALSQQLNRDTLNFAMKQSAAMINGVWVDTYKDPVDAPEKRSRPGRFSVVMREGNILTLPLLGNEAENLLQPVYHNGHVSRRSTWGEIRERAHRAATEIVYGAAA